MVVENKKNISRGQGPLSHHCLWAKGPKGRIKRDPKNDTLRSGLIAAIVRDHLGKHDALDTSLNILGVMLQANLSCACRVSRCKQSKHALTHSPKTCTVLPKTVRSCRLERSITQRWRPLRPGFDSAKAPKV